MRGMSLPWAGLPVKDPFSTITFPRRVTTDAIGTSYEDKTRGRTVVDVQGGNIGIEIRMGVAYSEAVVQQGMSLERYVAITSTNPASGGNRALAGVEADITVGHPSTGHPSQGL